MSVLVNKEAPDFTVPAVMPDGSTQDLKLSDYRGKYVVLFFYPKDFTFVCPSELIAFNHRLAEFEKRGVQVLGASIDDAETHTNWRNTAVEEGGIGELGYPLLCDPDRGLTNAYDLHHDETTFSLRGSFLIDKDGMVQHQVVNNLPLGRNIDDMLRTVDALQFVEQHGEVCPAGWEAGKAGMKPTEEGVASYLAEHAASL